MLVFRSILAIRGTSEVHQIQAHTALALHLVTFFFFLIHAQVKDKLHGNPLKLKNTLFIHCVLFLMIKEVQKSFNYSPVYIFQTHY